MALAKEQIRQIISRNDISSVADVYSLLKESFQRYFSEDDGNRNVCCSRL